MTDLFPVWWDFCQAPERDGHADDTTTDGAGATRWGWTYPSWRAANRYVGSLRSDLGTFLGLDQTTARKLASAYYWRRMEAPAMPAGVDISIIDWVWTSGGAVADIQAWIGAPADGVIGPVTLSMLREYRSQLLITNLSKLRIAYYDELGLLSRFPGLLARAVVCCKLSQQHADDATRPAQSAAHPAS
jgi:lysozyme family protein